jgi:hypothetical protein
MTNESPGHWPGLLRFVDPFAISLPHGSLNGFWRAWHSASGKGSRFETYATHTAYGPLLLGSGSVGPCLGAGCPKLHPAAGSEIQHAVSQSRAFAFRFPHGWQARSCDSGSEAGSLPGIWRWLCALSRRHHMRAPFRARQRRGPGAIATEPLWRFIRNARDEQRRDTDLDPDRIRHDRRHRYRTRHTRHRHGSQRALALRSRPLQKRAEPFRFSPFSCLAQSITALAVRSGPAWAVRRRVRRFPEC